MERENIRKVVRERYGKIAQQNTSCCASAQCCCGSAGLAEDISKKIGYTEEELGAVPEGANLGLGCGNPVAQASLSEGEIVLDLGSGAGFDCFLAAERVGKNGHVIGVDMTPDMLEKARDNLRKGSYENVEFRLGEIENLPVADNSVDVVISNCVINLSTDKKRVFRETLRVLKPGGRLMISDIVLLRELPDSIKDSIEAYIGCVSGAMMREEYLEAIAEAGFWDVTIIDETPFSIDCVINDPAVESVIKNLSVTDEEAREIAGDVVSIKVRGLKPETAL